MRRPSIKKGQWVASWFPHGITHIVRCSTPAGRQKLLEHSKSMIASKNLQLLAIPGKPSLRQNLEIGATKFYGELRKQRTARGNESKPQSVRTLWPRSTSRPNWEFRCKDEIVVAGRVRTRDLLVTFKTGVQHRLRKIPRRGFRTSST